MLLKEVDQQLYTVIVLYLLLKHVKIIYIYICIYICVYIYVDLYIINPKSSSLRSSLLLRCAVLMRKSVGQCYLKFLIKNTGTYNHKALLSLISPIFGRVTLVLL
jgi:hypothetical protein